MGINRLGVVVALCVASLSSCRRQAPADAAGVPPGAATARAPSLPPTASSPQVAALIRDTHFAFQPEGDHLAGGDAAYRVESAGAAVRVSVVDGARAERTSQPWTLTTTKVRRGAQELELSGPFTRAPRGQLTRGGAELQEEWANTAQGPEQRWRFGTQPAPEAATAPLEIRVGITGGALVESSSGVHGVDPVSGLAFRYGAATWIDADGRRTPIAARPSSGGLTLEIPSEVLRGARYPAVLDPTLYPEHAVDAPITVLAPRSQIHVAIAAEGTSDMYLAWEDTRTEGHTQVYGTFMNYGELARSATHFGTRLCPTSGTQKHPSVASNGTGFFVVWEERQSGANDVYGVPVSATGGVGGCVPISTQIANQDTPSIASDGTNYVVVWTDERNLGIGDLYSAQLSPSGVLLNGGGTPGGVQLTSGAVGEYNPVISWNGLHYLVAYQDYGTPKSQGKAIWLNADATRFAAPGTVSLRVYAADQQELAVTSDPIGHQSLAIWTQSVLDGGGADIWATRLGDGTVLDTAIVSATAGAQQQPAANFDGVVYWVAWSDQGAGANSGVEVTRINADSSPFSVLSTPFRVGTDAGSLAELPAISGGVNDQYVVFDDGNGNEADIGDLWVQRVGASSAIINDKGLGPWALSYSSNSQRDPAIAFDGTRFLVAWTDSRNFTDDSYDVYAVRVDRDGNVLDSSAIPVGLGAERQEVEAVGAGGGEFLVTWNRLVTGTRYELWATRLADDGTVLDPGGRMLDDAGVPNIKRNSVISYDGDRFLVVYRSNIGGLRYLFVGADGGVSPSSSLAPDGGGGASVAFDGIEHVVSYVRGTPGGLFVTRVLPDGGLRDPDGLGIQAGSPEPVAMTGVASAGGGSSLVAWMTLGASAAHLRGATLSAAGAVSASFPITASDAGFQRAPAVAWTGQDYAVLWQQQQQLSSGPWDSHASWLTPAGALELDDLAVATAVDPAVGAATPLATDSAGRLVTAFARVDDTPQIGVQRVSVRAFERVSALGAACTANTQCGTGFCSDGVCCDQACGGSDPTDCQACNAAGHCAVKAAATQCRAAQGACDVAESCDGASAACPADAKAAPTVVCNAAKGPCDQAETCDGVTNDCPADAVKPASAVCRAAAGGCDVPETCDGIAITCPADAVAARGATCRPATNSCDLDEVCNGSTADCPADLFVADGQVCQDGQGVCAAGACSVAKRSYYGWGCDSAQGALSALALVVLLPLFGRRRARRAGPLAVLAGALVWASAGDAAAGEKRMRLLFLQLTPGAGVSPQSAATASEYIQSELVTFEAYDVIGQKELTTILGVERQKQVLGCGETSSSCLEELAGALNADRSIAGDLSLVGTEWVLNLTLIDMRKSQPITRLTRRVTTQGSGQEASLEPLFDVIRPTLYELLQADTGRTTPVHYERGFGGILLGVRGEGDLTSFSPTPAITAELSFKRLGAALTVIAQPTPGVRAEGRYYPVLLGRVRPYLAVGATLFAPAVGARGALGADVAFGQLHLFADAAYEHFFNADPRHQGDAVLLGVGAGWLL